MKFHLYFLFILLTPSIIGTAQVPENWNEPNYIKRQNDFLARRQSSTSDPINSLYLNAFKQKLQHVSIKSKKGDKWTPLGPFGMEDLAGIGRVNSMQFHPTDTNTWYICVAQGGLWKTTNAGNSWTSISGDLPILRTSYLSIHPTNSDIMYVATGDFAYLGHNLQANENKRNSHYGLGVYKTTDGGITWKATGLSLEQTDFEASLISKILIHPDHPDTILAVGQSGAFYSENAGNTWTKTDNRLIWDLELSPTNNNTLMASTGYISAYKVGEAGILKTTNFGKTWTSATTPIPKTKAQRIELAYAPSDANYIYAIACDLDGGFYGFYRSTDGGNSFATRQDNNYPYNILNHSLDSEVGGQGRYDLAISVDRNDKNKVLTGGINIWQTTDGGANFKPVTYWLLNYYNQSLHADIHEIVQHPTNNSYFACHDGGISRTFNVQTDDINTMKDNLSSSTNWTNYTKGLNITSFYRLSIYSDNTEIKMAGAQDNSTVITDGTQFSNVSGGDGMESAFDAQSEMCYSSSQNGFVNAFIFDGNSLEYIDRITAPNGDYGDWTTPMQVANGLLYIGYTNLHSYSWGSYNKRHSAFNSDQTLGYKKATTALNVNGSNAIYMAKRAYASKNVQNEVWVSRNDGISWADISNGLPRLLYPSYVTSNPSKPNEVWIVFSGFNETDKVFRSNDYGANWVNITYNLPNIPVNCIAYQDEDNGITYVGTDLGVYYKHTDSTTWIAYNDLLPNTIVSELEIDTSKNTLVAATFGRGLWEIGLETPMVKDSSTRSIQSDLTQWHIGVYPNPATNYLDIQLDNIPHQDFEITVVDITGKICKVSHLANNNSTRKARLDISKLENGEYFVILKNDHSRSVARFLKVN